MSFYTIPDFTQEKLELLESYMKAVKLYRSYDDPSEDPQYSEVICPRCDL